MDAADVTHIRQATPQDVAHIVSMLPRYAALYLDHEIDLEDCRALIAALVRNEHVTVSEGGFFAATVQSDPTNRRRRIASEVFWFAEDGTGARHLRRFFNIPADEHRIGVIPGTEAHAFAERRLRPVEAIYRR